VQEIEMDQHENQQTHGDKKSHYAYLDMPRYDVLRMIPPDGLEIGSIGCGFANTEGLLVSQGRRIHGVDIASEAIEVARPRLTSARVISPDDRMPFAPDSLDGLILADVIEHMPLAWDRLADFVKMVRQHGWVVISVPNMRYHWALWRFVVGGDWPEEQLGIFDRTHLQVMTHKRLLRWGDSAGLALERWYDGYHFMFYPRNIDKLFNVLSFRGLRSFTNFQVQGRFRRIR
jgi:2-polyprenyl-3-methyl-5-hydroxy-6-metoxy-1,4-benzoquinol methylase